MGSATTEHTSHREDLPVITGDDAYLEHVVSETTRKTSSSASDRAVGVQAAFACALHMHQPTIPAGEGGKLISNLQHMFNRPHEGDNHNATVFASCYSRMGDIIPALKQDGCEPRIMLDYSGNLLWGLQQMGRSDIIENLRPLACDDKYINNVEWLGTMWSHAVVSSTPVPDLKLHMRAWQHCFASIFGADALSRVKGFSPPEMHLPNHPDVAYAYVQALVECGYTWLLVQEHTVETMSGSQLPRDQKYVPNKLVVRNSRGEELSITALIKTQGSDTKLVGQMQPYYEAKTLKRQTINGVEIPSLVTQIADGENGGVMMNEFPRDFPRPWYEIKDNSGSSVIGMNGSEYLAAVQAAGLEPDAFPPCQPVQQHKIWVAVGKPVTQQTVEAAIAQLKATDHQFHMDGGSWTNDLSWVRGYESILEPMAQLSAKFHQKFDATARSDPKITNTKEYQEALMYNLLLQTSCFRYWGEGTWTEYARELFRRGEKLVE